MLQSHPCARVMVLRGVQIIPMLIHLNAQILVECVLVSMQDVTYEPPNEKTNNVVSDQVRRRPGCMATKDSYWIWVLEEFYYPCSKLKAQVTAKLICAFVFAYQNVGVLMAKLIFCIF